MDDNGTFSNETSSEDATTKDKNIHPFQDDLNTDDNSVDPIMVEENDDPVEILGVPANELRDELNQYVDSGTSDQATTDVEGGYAHGTADDRREMIEDMDEDDKGSLPGN